jgi:hypothetical protein
LDVKNKIIKTAMFLLSKNHTRLKDLKESIYLQGVMMEGKILIT